MRYERVNKLSFKVYRGNQKCGELFKSNAGWHWNPSSLSSWYAADELCNIAYMIDNLNSELE